MQAGEKVEHWHLRKEVTLGTLITIIVYAIFSVILWVQIDGRVGKLEDQDAKASERFVAPERLAIAETRIDANKEATDRLEARTQITLAEINSSLRRIEDRLDRLAGVPASTR